MTSTEAMEGQENGQADEASPRSEGMVNGSGKVNGDDNNGSGKVNGDDNNGSGKVNVDEDGMERMEVTQESEEATSQSVCVTGTTSGGTTTTTTDESTGSGGYVYDFTLPLPLVTKCCREFSHKRNNNNFLKGCKWAPDGTCIMTNSDDNAIRLFNLPAEMYGASQSSVAEQMPLKDFSSVLRIQEGGPVYDFCWYPHMSSMNPETCCLASVSKDSPIHLWDAFDGQLRCSFMPINNVDEIVHAHSVAFNLTGEKLLAGFNNCIRIFDVAVPGRKCSIFNTYARDSDLKRQPGLISCMAPHPVLQNTFAAGSYLRTVGLYSMDSDRLLCLLEGQIGGVTHLQFSPDGTRLYAGGRLDPEILCWDIRNIGTVLFTLRRCVTTHQRIYFDNSVDGKYLVSGNSDNYISVWDVSKAPQESQESAEPTIEHLRRILVHDDCVNGVSVHRHLPIVATTSGQRHFPEPNSDEGSGSDSDSLLNWDGFYADNSLKIWWAGGNGRKEMSPDV